MNKMLVFVSITAEICECLHYILTFNMCVDVATGYICFYGLLWASFFMY